MASQYKYLAKNTLLFAFSTLCSKVILFFLVPLYTNILSKSDYGLADIILTSSYLLTYAFTLDIGDAVLRFAIERNDEKEAILSYGIKVLIVGSLFLTVGILCAWFVHLTSWNKSCYLFLLLYFFVSSLNQIISNYLRAIDYIKEVAISGIIQTITTVISSITLLVIFKKGINGYLSSIVLGVAISTVYCIAVIKVPFKTLLKRQCILQTRKEMLKYSIPLVFNGIAWWTNSSIDKYFVIVMLGVEANGLLAVSYKIPTILVLFHTVFARAWNLSAIREYNQEDKDGFFSNIYNTYNAGLILISALIILFNIPISKILFAKDFFEAWKYSSIFVFSTLFSCLSGILGSIFAAVKASKIFAYSTVTAAIINVVLNYFLISIWGIGGAAIATAISYIIVWLIRLYYTTKYIKLRINMVRNILCYALLASQIVFENLHNHAYWGQIFVVILLLLHYL